MAGQNVEYDKDYASYITLAGGTITSDPISLKGTIKAIASAVGTATVNSTPTVTTPTLGAAAQLANTAVVQTLYINITTAGTAFSIKVGPTVSVTTTLVASGAAVAGTCYTVRLPAGWYIAVAGTTAVWATTAITG